MNAFKNGCLMIFEDDKSLRQITKKVRRNIITSKKELVSGEIKNK